MQFVGGYVEGDSINLIHREGGVRKIHRVNGEWVTYFRLSDLGNNRSDIERSSMVKGAVVEGDEWLRVSWRSWATRNGVISTRDRESGREVANWFRQRNIRPYENDVSPIRRYFVDSDAETVMVPRVAYLDIETDSRVPFDKKEEMRILTWVVEAGCDCPERGIVRGEQWRGVLERDEDESEAELLVRLWETLEPFDVVAAWYGDGFDFPVIDARTKRHRLQVNRDLWRWLDHLEVYKLMNKNVAESGEERQSMALNAVCQAVLGEGKHDFDSSKTWEEWAAGGERRERMALYCAQDTRLLGKLEQKTGYIRLAGTICAASRLFLETHSLQSTAQMDGFMLRLGKSVGHHFPSRFDFEEPEKTRYAGAFVMEPKVNGWLRSVHVCDFSSLYPSIIISWNMSPETVANGPVNGPIPDGMCRAPTTGMCFSTTQEGLLPKALKTLIGLRKRWSDQKSHCTPGTPEFRDADAWSTAYKVLANSFYGVLGSVFSRYYNRQIAESVTQTGVWLIQNTIAEAKPHGIEVIYGDTDSAFAKGVVEEAFRAFVDHCNKKLYPALLERCRCPEAWVKLAYEKEFRLLIIAASKKYVGFWEHYKGTRSTKDSKPEIKGMEFKKGDTIALGRRLQGEVIETFRGLAYGDVDENEVKVKAEALIRKYLDKCLLQPLQLEDIVLAKTLTQSINAYVAKTPPEHVRIAKLLKERGQDVSVGTKIRYVILDAAPKGGGGMRVIPASEWTGECDRDGIWEKRVFPPTMRLLNAAFPGHGWERWGKTRVKRTRGRSSAPTILCPQGELALTPTAPPTAPPTPTQALPTRANARKHLGAVMDQQTTKVPALPSRTKARAATRVAGIGLTLDARGQPPDSRKCKRAIIRVKDVLDTAGPGSTKVSFRIMIDQGTANLLLDRSVSVSPELIAELKKIGVKVEEEL